MASYTTAVHELQSFLATYYNPTVQNYGQPAGPTRHRPLSTLPVNRRAEPGQRSPAHPDLLTSQGNTGGQSQPTVMTNVMLPILRTTQQTSAL